MNYFIIFIKGVFLNYTPPLLAPKVFSNKKMMRDEMRFIVLKLQTSPLIQEVTYWSDRYLVETRPDFRLVSNRYLPVSLPVAADHVGWLPVVHFCFSDTHIFFWITVISYLKRARAGLRVLFHNCSLKLQCVFRFLGIML